MIIDRAFLAQFASLSAAPAAAAPPSADPDGEVETEEDRSVNDVLR